MISVGSGKRGWRKIENLDDNRDHGDQHKC